MTRAAPLSLSLSLSLAILACGCRTYDPKHPALGRPEIRSQRVATWVWYAKDRWHVRLVGAGHKHRFQGTIEGTRGGVADLRPTRPELSEHIGADASAIHFDVETSTREDNVGFDAKVAGGCARFDFYTDGAQRGDNVYVGRRGVPARKVPFERCP